MAKEEDNRTTPGSGPEMVREADQQYHDVGVFPPVPPAPVKETINVPGYVVQKGGYYPPVRCQIH